jgi:hypothetical protein
MTKNCYRKTLSGDIILLSVLKIYTAGLCVSPGSIAKYVRKNPLWELLKILYFRKIFVVSFYFSIIGFVKNEFLVVPL